MPPHAGTKNSYPKGYSESSVQAVIANQEFRRERILRHKTPIWKSSLSLKTAPFSYLFFSVNYCFSVISFSTPGGMPEQKTPSHFYRIPALKLA